MGELVPGLIELSDALRLQITMTTEDIQDGEFPDDRAATLLNHFFGTGELAAIDRYADRLSDVETCVAVICRGNSGLSYPYGCSTTPSQRTWL